MSKYDDWLGPRRHEDVNVVQDLKRVFADIDARLAKLEAEAQKPKIATVWADGFPVGSRIPRTDSPVPRTGAPPPPNTHEAPTQPQREPGWYPVWSRRTGNVKTYWFDGGQWRERPGNISIVDLPSLYEDGFTVGPRIQPPEGAV